MVSSGVAIDLVEHHCGVNAAKATPFNDGVNTVFGVTTSAGDQEYVVKFGTRDPDAVQAEPHIIRTANSFGVPVPSIYADGAFNEVPYFVATWLHGQQPNYPMELSVSSVVQYARDVGRILAQLQSGQVPVGELSAGSNGLTGSHDSWRVFYQEHLVRFAEDAKRNFGKLGSDAVRLAHWATIPTVDETRLCPLDLHTHNIVYNDDSVVGVLDFERYYGGHPGWGVAVTKRALATGRPPSVRDRVREKFVLGYETVRPLPESHPVFDLGALLRELRAAHMWWDNADSHRDRFRQDMQDIEESIEELES